jgi:hypothetical protein
MERKFSLILRKEWTHQRGVSAQMACERVGSDKMRRIVNNALSCRRFMEPPDRRFHKGQLLNWIFSVYRFGMMTRGSWRDCHFSAARAEKQRAHLHDRGRVGAAGLPVPQLSVALQTAYAGMLRSRKALVAPLFPPHHLPGTAS